VLLFPSAISKIVMNIRLRILPLLLIFLISSLTAKVAHAKPIAAPNTTGTTVTVKGSQINIDGGDISIDGKNLFHRFQKFDLNPNQVANFITYPNLQNIFVEVSGGDSSSIEGLIQVSGSNSNLYLVNPAGVVFSARASLNVPAALTVTTANWLNFSDQWLSVTAHNNYAKLTGKPTGFLFDAPQPGVIINAGSLSTPNGGLTFWGNTVINKGNLQAGQVTFMPVKSRDVSTAHVQPQTINLTANRNLTLLSGQVQAKGDVTLLARHTLIVRDSPTTPSQIQTSANLILQGDKSIDILALNHPDQTSFISNGTLSLLSNGMISADSQFQSGKDFSIQNLASEPTNLTSRHNSIIRSDRNVDLGNYTGASLTVEARGSILAGMSSFDVDNQGNSIARVISTGNITISAPNQSDGALRHDPGDKTLTKAPALILRAGTTESLGNIIIDNIRAPAGVVDLKASGTVIANHIDTSSSEAGSNGGNIQIEAFNIFSTGKLDSSAKAPVELRTSASHKNGYGSENTDAAGNINLKAIGFLRTEDIDAFSLSGNGGNVEIEAVNATVRAINTTGSTRTEVKGLFAGELRSYRQQFQGGNVRLNASGPFLWEAITTEGGIYGVVSISSDKTPPTPDPEPHRNP
jgi:filamentous hemagglutinin family protein